MDGHDERLKGSAHGEIFLPPRPDQLLAAHAVQFGKALGDLIAHRLDGFRGRAMGAAFRLRHDGVDQFQLPARSWAVILSAVAASCALSALRHRIEAAPSGEITE